jgi:putative transposase
MKPCLPKAFSCLSCDVDIALELRYNVNRLKLTAQVKLVVTPEQSEALKRTMQAANAVCDSISAWAWDNQTFGQYPLHKAQYAAQRAASGLTAQVIVRCLGKVADAYKLDKRTQRTFQPTGAIAFDDRILNWYIEREQVSIWSVDGRLKLPFVCGEYQRGLLAFRQGEADLAFVGGEFYLMATVSIPDPPLIVTEGVLGVDLGIVSLAVDSEGNQYSGEAIKACRRRRRAQRSGLQKTGTKRAKRTLKKINHKASRYSKWLNHNISKKIVQTAVRSRKAIALETLTGIRERGSVLRLQSA